MAAGAPGRAWNLRAESVNEANDRPVRGFETNSAEETIAVGRRIAGLLQPPLLLILQGDLGAGKTTLVKGIVEAFGAAEAEDVTSPTFTLVHEYAGFLPGTGSAMRLYHLDLYRLEEERQLATLGIDEMAEPDSVVLVEWGEKFPSLVARADGALVLTHCDGDARSIVLRLNRERFDLG